MDMDMMKELLKAKQGDSLDPSEKAAGLDVLRQIHELASGAIGNDVKGLKQVTVAAPDDDGVMDGLKKAGELVGGKLDEARAKLNAAPMGKEGSLAEELSETPSEEAKEKDPDDMSDDEIDQLIAALQAKRAGKTL